VAKRGVRQCVLAGNSLGGQSAWNFALPHPETVHKLVLIDASGYPVQSTRVPIAFRIARIPGLNKILTFITPRFVVKSSVENVYADKAQVSEALVDRYFELSLRKGNRQALVDRMQMPYDTSQIRKIPNIRQPTLILWGESDGLIPLEIAYRFQQDLPNDTLVVLRNSGHVPMEENPRESLAVVLDFIGK
jgi:pimeloyl-ACP methyl ester carboxylesterase